MNNLSGEENTERWGKKRIDTSFVQEMQTKQCCLLGWGVKKRLSETLFVLADPLMDERTDLIKEQIMGKEEESVKPSERKKEARKEPGEKLKQRTKRKRLKFTQMWQEARR